jgi:hypothetical protein
MIDAVKSVLAEVESHKAYAFDRNFWLWQYRYLPSGQAKVYAILVHGEIKGYYHIPIYDAMAAGQKQLLAMVQEVAVSPYLRGQGMFRKLAEFATSDLLRSGIEAVYTFPNAKSIHTFLKYNGYQCIGSLNTYLLPLSSGRILRSKMNLRGLEKLVGFVFDYLLQLFRVKKDPQVTFKRLRHVDHRMIDVFATYQKQHRISLLRDASFLKWRFEQRPKSEHFYMLALRNKRPVAAAIFKADSIFDNPALLLMDFAFQRGRRKDLLQLIQQIKENHVRVFGRHFNLIMTSGCSDFLSQLTRIGFMRIPASINPRSLNLLVRNLSPNAQDVFHLRNWHITLSDWDVM